jgi:hypothetical protein
MRAILIKFAAAAVLAAGAAHADIRCHEPTLTNPLGGLRLTDAYKVLTWADKCRPPQFKTLRHGLDLQLAVVLANSDEATKGGTYFPAEGTPEYDEVRLNVRFPIFFLKGSLTFWRPMLDPGEIQTRIFNQDCGVVVPPEYEDVGFCTAGCFAPDQQLLFADEETGRFDWMRIDKAFRKRDFVAAVSQTSTLGHIEFVKAKVEDYTTDLEPGLRSVLRIETESGKVVRVTSNHPLLDGAGVMRRAGSLKVGDSLVTYLGAADPILSIGSESFEGRVYNLDIDETPDHRRVVAANGILSGTNWYQNRGRHMLDRLALRANLERALRARTIEVIQESVASTGGEFP